MRPLAGGVRGFVRSWRGMMIFYNVSVSVDPDIEKEWYEWMVREHIADVLKTGYFHSAAIARVLEPIPDKPSYQIKYSCSSLAQYQAYAANAGPALQRDHARRFKGRFSATRSLMELSADFPNHAAAAE